MRNIFSLSLVCLVAASSIAVAGDCRRSGRSYYRGWSHTRHYAAPARRVDHSANYRRPANQPKDIVDTAVSAGSFETLVAAVQAAELVDALKSEGPFTVFAPTDDAFAKLPEGTLESLLQPENKGQLQAILKYHVVPGKVTASQVVKLSSAKTLQGQDVAIAVSDGRVKVNNAKVVKTDINCSNGVIHVIDAVILPEEDTAAPPAPQTAQGEPATADIVETAVEAGSFETLVAAVKAADLVDTLQGEGPFTVFAPTDDAFAKLPEGTVADLLKPENQDKLKSILTYHVVPGRVLAKDVADLNSAETANGESVKISTDGADVRINGAKVLSTDIECSNGVIHVIDTVLIP